MKQQLPRLRFRSPTRVLFFISLLLLVMLIGISGVTAQDGSPTSTPVPHTGDSNPGLVTALAQGGAQIAYHEDTGAARFITAAPGRPIAQPVALQGNASREAAARGFLATYGPLFGIRDQSRELVRKTEKKPDANRTFERFQQVYNGVPVIGGELIVQVDSSNAVLSANGEVLPRIALSTTTPTITAAQAAQNALAAVAKYHNIAASDLAASTPVLSIYSPILISPDDGPTSLVWRMDVTRKSFVDIDEFVLIDAQRGSMTLHFSQIDNVLSRQVYSANHSQNLPGSLVCSEQDWNCDGDLDAQLAFDGAADTYNYYFNHFGRDSINNAGMTIKSTVHFGVNYQNAFWNGTQMVYGDGFAQSLDVVAHELTHGVTENESGLFYYYQAGAINESFSDVFGEFVQQEYDPSGSPWLIAEDLLIGAIRSMSNPPAFGDPDKMTSANYSHYLPTSAYFDYGGVHTNSGINNKAAYLMAAGGTFNGRTVTALGNDKTAAIYYEAQTNLMTSGTDYGDLYNMLYQACYDLIGSSVTTVSDCQEVRDATDAVEMNLQPTVTIPAVTNPEAPLCPSGQNVNTVAFSDDMESGTGKWSFGANVGSNHWRYDAPVSYGQFAHSGLHFLYADDYPDVVTDTYAAMASGVVVPSNAYLHFAHAFGFDQYSTYNFDGGILEYSLNGGGWVTADAFFDNNGYNGTIYSGTRNPLGGFSGFVGDSHGYISSRVNLSSFAGKNIRFRWRMGLDSSVYNWGWWLDDVKIYNCAAPPANDNFASPTSVTSLPYSNTQSTSAASLELVEQKASCDVGSNIQGTVWYQYTAGGNQTVTFSATDASTVSTVVKGISVWTGSNIGALTQMGCATGVNAATSVSTTNGTVYYIRVGTKNGAGTNIGVAVALQPPNDNFASAIRGDTGFTTFTDTQNVLGATLEFGDPAATCGGAAFRTVWYTYQSLGTFKLDLNTTGSNYDTVLSVWTGTGLGALTQAACNDDAPSVTTSAYSFTTAPGKTYFIRVGSKGGANGSLTFHMTASSPVGGAPALNFFTTPTPTLSWNRVTSATKYKVQVSTSSTFTSLAFTKEVPASQLSVQTTPLGEGYYYWRVSANGGTTWSAVETFTIDLP